MTEKLSPEKYADVVKYIDREVCGAVYPLSVALGIQPGDIFAGPRSALIWHRCGFAHVFGECEREFLEEIYGMFFRRETERRFVLFATDGRVKRLFLEKGGVAVELRYFFEYPEDRSPDVPALPAGYCLSETDERLFERIEGGITPLFSWEGRDVFLEKGKCFCVTDGELPAAWAFSAAVSDSEIDIGVETRSEYRRRGLAAAAAAEMIGYTRRQGKRPVWACHAGNAASQKLAERLGFVKVSECEILRV